MVLGLPGLPELYSYDGFTAVCSNPKAVSADPTPPILIVICGITMRLAGRAVSGTVPRSSLRTALEPGIEPRDRRVEPVEPEEFEGKLMILFYH